MSSDSVDLIEQYLSLSMGLDEDQCGAKLDGRTMREHAEVLVTALGHQHDVVVDHERQMTNSAMVWHARYDRTQVAADRVRAVARELAVPVDMLNPTETDDRNGRLAMRILAALDGPGSLAAQRVPVSDDQPKEQNR